MATENFLKCSVHPDEEAALTCGGCGKPVCTCCMTLTGEGVRCDECMARLNARSYGTDTAAEGTGWVREPEQVVIPADEYPSEAPPKTRTASSEPQLIEINPVTGEVSTDITFCTRHPQVETGLRCGRCQTPICPRCMIYTAVGLRCPDCYDEGQVRPKAKAKATTESKPRVTPDGRIIERDTGFRTYWKRTPARYLVEPQHYALAVVAAAGAALVGGGLWGFFLDAGRAASRGVSSTFVNSVHILPELLLGVVISEAIARATRDRRGPGLQIIAMLGVLFSYFVAIATLIVRALQTRGIEAPEPGQLIDATWKVFTGLFSGGGSGTGISMLFFFALGAIIGWIRLKP